MKFKKTKLTALAMSVLMAASTITSVTWAADLFTDGAPAEVAVEAPVEVISDGEAEASENAELLGKNIDSGGEMQVYDPYEDNKEGTLTYTQHGKDDVGVFLDPADGQYKIWVWITADSELKEYIVTLTESEPATCKHPARKKGYFERNGVKYDVYYYSDSESAANYNPDEHHVVEDKILTIEDVSVDKPDCEKPTTSITYQECSICHALKDLTVKKWEIPSLGSYRTIEDYLKGEYKDEAAKYVEVKELSIKGHTPGTTVTTTLPPKDVDGVPYADFEAIKYGTGNSLTYDGYNFTTFSSITASDLLEYFNDKANCKITGTTHSGAMDPALDAYVYEVTFCKDCGKVIEVKKDTFYRANITESTEFYAGEENIAGFLDAYGNLHDTIDKDKLVAVVLKNCELDGRYNLCVTSKDFEGNNTQSGYSVVKTYIEPAGHKWATPTVTPAKGSASADFKLDAKKNIYCAKNDKGEWVAYAKDCSTTAYYTLEQHCNNPFCKYHVPNPSKNIPAGESNPDIGGEKKALPGDHKLYREDETTPDGRAGRYVDPAKTVYEQIKDAETGEVDKEHHLEKYTDRVECRLCHWKGWADSNKADALVDHAFAPKEVAGTRIDATCGTTGSYDRVDTCLCGYTDDTTKTTVTIPATDDHKFGKNPARIVWSGGNDGVGAIYIENGYIPGVSLHADIVRECTVCHKLDSNGINTMIKGTEQGYDVELKNQTSQIVNHFDKVTQVPGGYWCAKLRVKDIVPAKQDPATGISYRCSTAHATVYVDWVGTVDGKVTELSGSMENVPYYVNNLDYQGRTAHTPGAPKKENVKEGSYDEVVYCTVCGDIVSSKTVTVTPEAPISVPTVTATAVNYNTVNVSWTPVDGATSYRLYYRSADLGITTWHRVRTLKGTSFTHSGLTTGARYRYTVRAEVNGKLGDYSKTGSVARPLPAAPEMKSVTAVSNGTKVTWSKVDGADGYIIFRKTTGAFTRVGAVSKGSKVTWTDKKPVSGATYKVRAYRTVNNVNYKGAFSAAK